MREIEFRAYSKSLKRMLSFEHLKEATKGMVDVANAEIQKRGLKFNKLSPYGLFLPLEDDDLEFMQFTGLTDKNGKKIFEGDIIEFDDKCYLVVQWSGAGYFELRIYDAEDDYKNIYRTPIWNYNLENMEIIGNIWDNHELLEVKDE